MQEDKSYRCPQCGSASIDISGLVGGGATCRSCQWTGSNQDVIVHFFKHDLGSDAQIMETLLNEYKVLLAKNLAHPFAAFLVKWGFLPDSPKPAELTRYIVAMARASIGAILEVRTQVEKEEYHGGN